MLPAIARALRSWKHAKAVAALSIATLAIGIGSTTAIYTVISCVILSPLPYQYGDRYVALFGGDVKNPTGISSNIFPDLQKYRDRTQSFDGCGGSHSNLVRTHGVTPLAGEWFRREGEAVISSRHRF